MTVNGLKSADVQLTNYSLTVTQKNYEYTKLGNLFVLLQAVNVHSKNYATRMWANAQRDGRPAEHRRRPLFNAAKFG